MISNRAALFLVATSVFALSAVLVSISDAGNSEIILFFALVAAAATLYFAARDPAFAVKATIFTAFLATPQVVPTYFAVAGIAVYPYEILLAVSLLGLIRTRNHRDSPITGTEFVARGFVGLFVVAIVIGAVVGTSKGFDRQDLLTDIRPLIDFIVAILVGSLVVRRVASAVFVPVIVWTLWLSALCVVGAATIGYNVNGRVEEAQLYRSSGGALTSSAGAMRYLTTATSLAVACLCGTIILVLLGRLTILRFFAMATPAFILCALSFSRNQLIGIVAAVAFVALVAMIRSSVGKFGKGALVLVFALILPVLAFSYLPIINENEWLTLQTDAYTSRVIGGLSSESRGRDSSISDRIVENRYLSESIENNPVVGSGMGYAYKPASGDSGSFASDRGRLYAHNFYLWIQLKAGLLGLISFVGLCVVVLYGCLFARGSVYHSAVIGGVVASCIATSFFAPMPIGFPTSLLFGLAIGGAIASPSIRESATKKVPDNMSTDRTVRV